MKLKQLYSLALIFSLFLSCSAVAQESYVTLSKLVSFVNQPKAIVEDKIKKSGYKFTGVQQTLEEFTKSSGLRNSKLLLAFKNRRFSSALWTENLLYAKWMIADVENSNFTLKEHRFNAWHYEDIDEDLQLILFDNSSNGYMSVTLGHIK
jgi:hypothetical protein